MQGPFNPNIVAAVSAKHGDRIEEQKRKRDGTTLTSLFNSLFESSLNVEICIYFNAWLVFIGHDLRKVKSASSLKVSRRVYSKDGLSHEFFLNTQRGYAIMTGHDP